MAENQESLLDIVKEKIEEKIHAHDSSSSSSDSELEVEKKPAAPEVVKKPAAPEVVKKPAASEVEKRPAAPSAPPQPKVFRLFGRERPVHAVLGGGKFADVFLWRNKKVSGSVLGTATAIWVLFELVEYHLLTLVCHTLILSLALLFLWSNAHTFINKSPPRIPEVHLPEEPFLMVASQLTSEINWGFAFLREIASGKQLKKFLMVVAGLWILSIVGSWCNFLTLFYIVFVLLHTVPVLYEKFDHKIDPLAEKATTELKRHYAVFDEKVLSKIPVASLKAKRV